MPTPTPNLDRAQDERIVKGPKQSLIDTFNQTNLDTQNEAPEGGPINAPQYNFSQTYSINNPYFIAGTQFQESILSSSLDISALDVENPEAGVPQGAEGGPRACGGGLQRGARGADVVATAQPYRYRVVVG